MLLILIAWSLLISSCHDIPVAPGQTVDEQFHVPRVNRTVSDVKRDGTTRAAEESIRVDSRHDLLYLTFVDSLHGWFADTNEAVFRTVDGGLNWRRLRVPLQPNAEITGLTFFDRASGWITVRETHRPGTDFTNRILGTTDGGESWTVQSSEINRAISAIRFVDKKIGWAAGTKIVREPSLYGDLLVLSTEDGGETWADRSKGVSSFSEHDTSNMQDVVDLGVTNHNSVRILTGDNRIIETHDGGLNWRLVDRLDPGNKSLHFVLKPDGHLSIVAGVDGKEGMSASYFIKQLDGSWDERVLSPIYLKDAVHLTNDRVFACGSILPKDYQTGRDDNRRFGVVVYSSDGGKNWRVIYENKRVPRINAISLAGSEKLFLAGDGGTVAFLDLQKAGL